MSEAQNRDRLRGRRLMLSIIAESEQTRDVLTDVRGALDERLAVALRLLADASQEYVRAVSVLEEISRSRSLRNVHALARAYMFAIGRRRGQ